MTDPSLGEDLWVVWSFEHRAWWKRGGWGYTPELAEAGWFTKREALEIEHAANVVALNERALRLTDAEREGPPPSPPRAT